MNKFPKALLSFANLFGRTQQRETFKASNVNEVNVTQGIDWNGVYRDRYNYQRQTVLDEALLAWRLNPMARRILNLQKQYIIDGIEFDVQEAPNFTTERSENTESSPSVSQNNLRDLSGLCGETEDFLTTFWNHPLNKIGSHLGEWADELALTGNLFVLLTTDKAGMSYLRVYPTDQIAEIETASNDVQQETGYICKQSAVGGQQTEPVRYPNYWANQKSKINNRKSKTVMLHYAVNRLAGMKWGEPDIAPLLPWLARYASWLEDRVRLNRFRQAFLYVVTGRFNNEAEKTARQKEINANPPMPGSVLVTDDRETWSVIQPQMDSFEANADGLALKKFIAGGMGYPLHWLAEPESSTRTTAEAAGTPTFKSLEERQKMFLSMIKDILQVVIARSRVAATKQSPITVRAADITERDNAALALASTQIVSAFGQLVAGGFITADEYMRIVYRFAGETMPSDRPDAPSAGGGKQKAGGGHRSAEGIHIDSKTGEVSVNAPEASS